MSQVKGLIRNYGDFRIDIPEWTIADQGITALWGASGSGKTTVFRLLIGLEPCATLTWTFGHEDVAKLAPPARHVGVVFQTLELFPHMTAAENILFASEARGQTKDFGRSKLDQLTKDLHLEKCIARRAHLLSGGEAQRVALARAVIAQPRFLFLDEPFSSLDSELKKDSRSLVKSVIEKLNIPTLLITHDPEDLTALAQHVVKIQTGRLL